MKQSHMAVLSTRKLENKMKQLAQSWENFISGHSSQDHMRNTVLGSWKRCQEFGVNPKQKQTTLSLSDDELHDLLQRSKLYSAAKPFIDKLSGQIMETGYLITLSDNKGRIIYLQGERHVRREGELMNFVPGADWSEHAAGTNAIGTSITTRMPVQIFSAEHFCQGCHPWICSSAPIIDPLTDELMGVLDLTGLWYEAQPHSLGLVTSSALFIQQHLAQTHRERERHLLERFHQASVRWPQDTVVLLGTRFNVLNRNRGCFLHWNLDKPEWLHACEWKPLLDELNSPSPQNAPPNEIDLYQLHARAYVERIILDEQLIGFLVVLQHHDTRRQPSVTLATTQPPDEWQEILGESPEIRHVIEKCRMISDVNVTLLLTGESGTGKEKLARAVHKSSRGTKPFVAINCGAIPKDLIASDLFGYEPGTFTGGTPRGKKGKFEEADGGTMFLDEIGEMPLDLQVHLLRVLQEKEVVRLGSSKPIPVDVRIIAATNRDLKTMVAEGKFRSDLYYRLNTVSIHLPSLRERKEDIPLLAQHYLDLFSRKYTKPVRSISSETLSFLFHYHWPGNIRELQNAIEHAVLFTDSAEIAIEDLPPFLVSQLKHSDGATPPAATTLSPVEQEEKKILEHLLLTHQGNLSVVARECKIARTTLYRRLRKYQLKEPARQ